MESNFQSRLDELNQRIRDLTDELAEKDNFSCKLLEDK